MTGGLETGADRPRFCSNCGGQISAGASFCPSCGTAVATAPIQQSGTPHVGPDPIENSATGGGTGPSKSRTWLIVAVVGVLVLAAGGVALAKSQSSDSSQATRRAVSHTVGTQAVALPVKECPTTQGIQGTSPSSLPSTITMSLPSSMAKSVAYYSDSTRSIAPIMAPAGWSCNVVEAVDGSITVSVFPRSESATFASQTSSPQPFATSKAIAVVADSGGACQGCVADIACPLISYVGTQTGQTTPCPNTQPTGEDVKWLNGSPTMGSSSVANDAVSFEDPPGVAGEGDPSGGPYPANGVLLYSYAEEGSASVVTCTLPPSQHDLCMAILNDFSTRNWPSAGAVTTPTTTEAPVATTSPPTTAAPSSPTAQPSCSDTVLFPLVAQAEPSVSPTDVSSGNGSISAYCSAGWAVLLHFTVQAGSGDGIALFQQSGDSWQFVQLGDDSGDEPACSQYPTAALQALGSQLCG